MDKQCKEFIEKCENSHTTVAVFIRLAGMWSRLTSDQRGEIIDYEIEAGRLVVDK